MPLDMDALGRQDAGLANAANELAGHEQSLLVLSAVGRQKLAPPAGLIWRIRNRITPMSLQGAVIARTPTELIVLSRVAWISKTAMPELSLKRTVIVLSQLGSVTVHPHDLYPDAVVVELRSLSSRLELVVLPEIGESIRGYAK